MAMCECEKCGSNGGCYVAGVAELKCVSCNPICICKCQMSSSELYERIAALEAELADLRHSHAHAVLRWNEEEKENAALREIVRAADEMREAIPKPQQSQHFANKVGEFDAAREKVNL